ncbi:MAG: nuclear transport factor 2 family protein [Longimicrobiales bacterium]
MPHSAVELERFLAGQPAPHSLYIEDARLRTPDGTILQGRSTIQAYLSAVRPPSAHNFEFFQEHVYRCGADRGIETGRYRAERREGLRTLVVVGRWYAEWQRTGKDRWAIREGRLLGPGEPLPDIRPDCVDAAEEVRASSRFTASLQGAPFGFFTADPHEGVRSLGRFPYYADSVKRPGIIFSAGYRVGRWLTVGGYGGRDPHRRTTYRLGDERQEWLTSRLSFLALAVGYQGRNVSLDVGPARVRSHWDWSSSVNVLLDASTDDSRWGAVVTARAMQSLSWDLGIEIMVQYRFFGVDRVPRTESVVERAWSGFFIGLGVALRRTE